MAGGLAALLDDVALIAKAASATSTKAAAVVVDDAAVTPQYVSGIHPSRELPIIWKIARGSLVNKAILIVVLMVLDHFLPIVLTPLLMLGGLYLSFEGAEKVMEAVGGGHKKEAPPAGEGKHAGREPVSSLGAVHEKKMVKGAIMTDFILSAEIMVISLTSLNGGAEGGMGLVSKALTLAAVAILMTVIVYGAVGLLVKLDDIGLALEEKESAGQRRLGSLLVAAMPKVLDALSGIGMVAMLWVGGHILLTGTDKLGWHAPYGLLHLVTEPVHAVPGVGAVLAWLLDTLGSAIVGLAVGAVLAGIVHMLPLNRHDVHEPDAPAAVSSGDK
ncbi:hypothetical protein GA0111570_109106 [Raineyella antarctica]|uniref:Inner membrane protein YedI n=1 Tax=Raineyella antarctica TaxID=1577474 RepID=A0A1G6HG56_9ACTN|nr:DUF808 domain-containing protein [Raineyella antarctica]SDB93098.1 hypothetical protein GA0111570_109106 [Raineyella antarctica]